MSDSGLSLPAKIVVRFLLTILLVWLLSNILDQYFSLSEGFQSYFIVAALLTLMNIIVRPFLHVLFAPFHFLFGVIATILMNLLFLRLTMAVAEQFDPAVVTFFVLGGMGGFLIVAIILGLANWVMKELLRG